MSNEMRTPGGDVPERAEHRYDFRTTEQKWQARWREADLFRTDNSSDRPTFYALVFFPYPSGAGISIGHCKNYVPVDVAARARRMQGFNVLHPMGWDAFGQPAENEAIKQGRNPREMVPEYAANYRRQLDLIGISYDWSREINSSDPAYYRWTQWLFLLLYRRGLAYRANAPVNWCPQDKTVLANEEVVNGRCWRCSTLVERRPMPQWFFRITAYADRLIAGLDTIAWPDGITQMQREWIGRSEGAEVDFPVVGNAGTIRVFTTRPDTLWGATFMVLAPEHPLVEVLTTPDQAQAVRAYRERAQRTSDIERQSTDRVKSGVFTGGYAVNPVNGARIPVWIADYVLMGYGTGAIMAVPAHDQRDFEFARTYGLEIRLVYRVEEGQTAADLTEALPQGGVMVDTGPFTGRPNDRETVGAVIRWLETEGTGTGVVNYRLRDWLISRQRYWGAPIPIVYCDACGEQGVPDDRLPVLLPEVERYQPTGTGESPLAAIPGFVHTTCPACGGPARRETDTMGGFACSSWYFLRFADPHNDRAPFDRRAADDWLPVDLYSGGAEHAVMHLLYARFWTKVMHDAGLIGFDEPFSRLRNQGMLLAWTPGREIEGDTGGEAGDEADTGEPIENWKVLKPDERQTIPRDQWVYRWVKMSKSLGNVVTPDEMAEQYGADSLRTYLLFAAPFEDTVLWKDTGGVEAASRFLGRLWRVWHDLRPHYEVGWRDALASMMTDRGAVEGEPADARRLRRKLHQTIRKVGEDVDGFRFNTAVAALMELVNELSALRNAVGGSDVSPAQRTIISEALELLPLLLSPMAPHLADELWERLGKDGFACTQAWPAWDPQAATEDTVTIVVQVNGKVRDRLVVAAGTPLEEVQRLALASERVRGELNGRQVRKVVPVPDKLVNIVVG